MFAANNNSANALDAANTSLANGTQPSVLGSNSDLRSLSTENLNTGISSSSNCLPDLIVTEWGAPSSAKAGELITLSYTEKNDGGNNADKHFVGFYLSKDNKWDSNDTLIDATSFDAITSLGAGASTSGTKQVTLDKNLSAGDYYVLYVADDLLQINESNETNNVVAQQICIQAPSPCTQPDLIVTEWGAPSSAKAGEQITLSYTEKNDGSKNADKHFVGFYLSKDNKWDSNDTLIDATSFDAITSLGAGASTSGTKQVTLAQNLSAGDYYVLYVADDLLQINESNETNNVVAQQICIQAPSPCTQPDLIVTEWGAPSSAKAGEQITLSYTEKNDGSKNADKHYVGFYLSKDNKWDSNDTLIDATSFDAITSLGAGASTSGTKQVTLDKNLSAGDYYVLYVADDLLQINESNETNNVVAQQICIQAPSPCTQPDLIVTEWGAPSSAKAGELITLSYTEKNVGSENADKHYVGFYLSKDNKWDSNDTLIDATSFDAISSLGAGASTSGTKQVTLAQNLSAGDYYVLYVADDLLQINESNETNNVVAKKICIQAPC